MRVLFNASVILAGLKSANGASGTLLRLAGEGIIEGVISEPIFDEVVRHAKKIGMEEADTARQVLNIFPNPVRSPDKVNVTAFRSRVVDPGDAHVLAAAEFERCEVLVSLDKKHILAIREKIKEFEIRSPGQLLKRIRFHPVDTKRKGD